MIQLLKVGGNSKIASNQCQGLKPGIDQAIEFIVVCHQNRPWLSLKIDGPVIPQTRPELTRG